MLYIYGIWNGSLFIWNSNLDFFFFQFYFSDVYVVIIFFSHLFPADSWNKQSSSAISGLTNTHWFVEGLSWASWKSAETSTLMCGGLQTYVSVDTAASQTNVSIMLKKRRTFSMNFELQVYRLTLAAVRLKTFIQIKICKKCGAHNLRFNNFNWNSRQSHHLAQYNLWLIHTP